MFFAFFNDLEAYGTLIELGMAHARGKRIVVGFSENVCPDPEWWGMGNHGRNPASAENNLWFAARCTEDIFVGTKDKILKQFGDWLARHYPVPREVVLANELSDSSRSSITIFYGDPVDGVEKHNWISWDGCFLERMDGRKRSAAALVARQSRFEHGQSGASTN